LNEAEDIPPNLPFSPGHAPRDGDPPECCPGLQPDLDAYAEGDAYGKGVAPEEARARKTRRHLQECASCHDYLEQYDALTRAILSGTPRAEGGEEGCAGGELEHRRRVHLIMERIHAEAAPAARSSSGRSGVAGRGRLGSPGPSADSAGGAFEIGSRWAPRRAEGFPAARTARAWLSAAAVILLGVALFWLALPRRDAVDDEVAGVAGSELGDGSSQMAREVGGDAAKGEDAAHELRWVVDPDSPARVTARGFPADGIRLLGFRPSERARDVPEEGRKLEWVVHAGLPSRALLASEARYFLVSEVLDGERSTKLRTAEVEPRDICSAEADSALVDSAEMGSARVGSAGPGSALDAAPTEIAPLTWYVPSESDAVAAPRRGERAYRVYVLPGLRVPLMAAESEEDLFPLLKVRPRGGGTWTLPASFQQ